MRNTFPFLFFVLLISPVCAGEKLNYEDLESLIKIQNKKVSAARLDLQSSDLRLGYLRRSFLPTLDASLGQEEFKTGPFETMAQPMYYLRANLNLFRGGRDQLLEKTRQTEKTSLRFQAQQVYQTELLELRQFFWDLVYLKELKSLLEDAIKQNETNLQRAMKRINAGLTSRVDRLEFEISGTQLSQDLARIEVELSNTQRHISALVGKDPETQYETISEIPHDHDDPTEQKQVDFLQFRNVQLEMANKTNLEAQSQILKRWWTPSLDLYAESILFNYRERNFTAQDDRIDNALGVKLSFEFDGFQQKYDGEALAARSRAAEMRAAQIKSETEAEYNTARQQLVLLHDLIHVGEKNVRKGQEYFEVTLSDYNKGIKNSPDVLSAMVKNLEFRRRFVELRRDYAVSKAKLQAIISTEH